MSFLTLTSRRLVLRLAAPGSLCRQSVAPKFQSQSRILQVLASQVPPSTLISSVHVRLQSSKSRGAGQESVTEAVEKAIGNSQAVIEEAHATLGLSNGAAMFAAAVEGSQSKKKMPEFTTSRAVGLWLLGSALSVFGIVVFGGLTRLTESGYAAPI